MTPARSGRGASTRVGGEGRLAGEVGRPGPVPGARQERIVAHPVRRARRGRDEEELGSLTCGNAAARERQGECQAPPPAMGVAVARSDGARGAALHAGHSSSRRPCPWSLARGVPGHGRAQRVRRRREEAPPGSLGSLAPTAALRARTGLPGNSGGFRSRELRAKSGEPSAECGETSAECGEPSAECGETSAESGETSAESRVPSAESRVPRAESQVPRAESQVPSAESQVPSAESQVPRAESRVRRAECGAPSAERRVRSAECGEPRSESEAGEATAG